MGAKTSVAFIILFSIDAVNEIVLLLGKLCRLVAQTHITCFDVHGGIYSVNVFPS